MISFKKAPNEKLMVRYGGPYGFLLIPVFNIFKLRALDLHRNIFAGASIQFLEKMQRLESLRIMDWKIQNLGPLLALADLENLDLSVPNGRPLSLKSLSKLKHFGADFTGCVRDLESCKMLESLFYCQYKNHDLTYLEHFDKLRSVDLRSTQMARIGTLRLPQLEHFEIRGANQFNDSKKDGEFPRLKRLILSGCPHLEELNSFADASCVERIVIDDCPNLATIEHFRQFRELRSIYLTGSTRIRDGRISWMLELPNLKEVFFCDHKNYDSKLASIEAELKRK